ncbi:MAG: DUF5691 domain-containing protein, partial [Pseudoclavibacter sp.]|nr:DUF5691 domain-containing protein [Pseudoclavibacter sp.]
LERQWDGLGTKARARLLPELGEGLSGADEPLLEGALDDPRQEVRRAAIGLLQRLPESRFARRMAERLRPLVEVRERGDRLRVGAPERLEDAAERRDGFERQTPAGGQGPAARLGYIVASAPLQTWRELTGMDPERTAQALRGDRTLLPAISKAAVLQRDRRWATALARVSEDPDLVEALDDQERRTVLHARRKASLQRLDELGRAAVRSGRPWPADFALDVLERLIAQPRSADSWHARSLLAQLHALLPEDAVDAVTGLAEAPAAAEHPLRPLLLRPGRIRTARRTLQEAFS